MFELTVEISRTEYRARCPQGSYEFAGPALCMTTQVGGHEAFLVIGQGEESFAADPEFHRMKQAGELRIFNPFDGSAFEPVNAADVIRFFLLQARLKARGRLWAITGLFDRYTIVMKIEGLGSLTSEVRNSFLAGVRSIAGVKYLRYE